jgi:hypothetical protein
MCLVGFGLVGVPAARATEAARLRIKNGHHLMVNLGKTRQDAIGLRPEKKVWQLDLGAELVGAAADFQDVTPNGHGERWNLPVAATKIELDTTRFLPSHIYRLEIRRARVLVGTAFVYLYPPPAERVRRVELDDRPADGEALDASPLGVIPKSGL